jgi:hypothetical protein
MTALLREPNVRSNAFLQSVSTFTASTNRCVEKTGRTLSQDSLFPILHRHSLLALLPV